MRRQTHKEQMQVIKENDPILYSELTSNPTGSSSDEDRGCVTFIAIIIVLFLCFIYFFGEQSPR